ncbi:MAG: transglutaminase domain-containing protein [Clostridia bacterium]|nr:transglutaminase domain-containing protein [Clostridia bacterium]
MSKGSKIICTLLVILLVYSAAIGTISALGQLELKKTVEDNNTEMTERLRKITDSYGEDPGTEDDVLICGEYTIRSTRHISDAYLSGDTSALSDRDKETLDMAKAVLDEIITDGMTDFEKEEAAYLWLTTKLHADTGLLDVIPSTDDGADNPYGVLKNHDAVCVGYATTMRLFMQMLGIECKVIHSSDLIHSWNLVNLDGDWYHVDCYSDAEAGNYANFNMDDTRARSSHDWNAEFFPAANGTKYSYAEMNAVEIKNIYSIPKAIKKLLESEQSIGCYTFRQKIGPDDESAAAAMISGITERVDGLNETSIECVWSKNADGDFVLSVYITRYNEENETDVNEETQEKIDQAIEDALGDYISEHQYDDSDDYYWSYNGTNAFEAAEIATTAAVLL